MTTEAKIIEQLARIVREFNPTCGLASILNSYGDTLTDDEVLDMVKAMRGGALRSRLTEADPFDLMAVKPSAQDSTAPGEVLHRPVPVRIEPNPDSFIGFSPVTDVGQVADEQSEMHFKRYPGETDEGFINRYLHAPD